MHPLFTKESCLCGTPVTTGANLIAVLSIILDAIAIFMSAMSATEAPLSPLNETSSATTNQEAQLLMLDHVAYYVDRIVIEPTIFRHLVFYLSHFASIVTAILLIVGVRRNQPKLVKFFMIMQLFLIGQSIAESALALVAGLNVRGGGYANLIPFDPPGLRRLLVVVLLLLSFFAFLEMIICSYFVVVVYRAYHQLKQTRLKNTQLGGFGWNHELNVSYANNAADGADIVDDRPVQPATARI